METKQKYFAFISYQRDDEEWAKWLAHELEHYHLPSTPNGRDDFPQELRPIFRDIDELSAGNLPQQIHNALECSKHLIVICSPQSAKSPWVNKEIEEFIRMGKTDKIFPFIIDGIAMCKNPDDPEECFPPALRNLPKDDERLGANINENGHGNKLRACNDCPIKEERIKQGDIYDKGRDAAVVKIVAGMLGLSFDTLWQRHEKEKAEEERNIREQRDNLLRVQSRFLAEKANALVNMGDCYTAMRLLLEILPLDLSNPNRPYTAEAEAALRRATQNDGAVLKENYSISSIACSPDGKHFFTANSTIKIWDIQTGKNTRTFKVERGWGNIVIYRPDGKAILSVNAYDARILDIETGKTIQVLEKETETQGHILCITYSTDKQRILSINSVSVILIWNALTGKIICSKRGFNDDIIMCAAFSPNAKRIVYSTLKGAIRIWDIEADNLIGERIEEGLSFRGVAFSPDGKRIVSSVSSSEGNETLRIWNAETMQPIGEEAMVGHRSIQSVAFSSDGKYIVAATWDSVRLLNAHTGKQVGEPFIGHTDGVTLAVLSPNCRHIISTSYNDKTVRIWKTQKNLPVDVPLLTQTLETQTHKLTHKHSTKYHIIDKTSRTIHVSDITGKRVELLGHTDEIPTAYFSPDEKHIISASWDHTARIWDVQSGKQLVLMKHADSVCEAVYSPDGKYIVSRSGSIIYIWDAKTGNHVHPPLIGHTELVNNLEFNIDGTFIVSTSYDGTIFLWDIRNGKQIGEPLVGHRGRIDSVIFSPDDKYILSFSLDDKTIRVWNVQTSRQVWITFVDEDNNYPMELAFSPNGKKILANLIDHKTTRIWDFPPLQELIDETRERFKENPLTPEERKKYYLD